MTRNPSTPMTPAETTLASKVRTSDRYPALPLEREMMIDELRWSSPGSVGMTAS